MSLYVPPTVELSMVGVLEAGVPNRERICLRPTDTINLAEFGLIAAIRNQNGPIAPLPNFFFWFGEKIIEPPSWIMVFTGKGEPKVEPVIEKGQVMHIFFWNLETTIFNIANVVPVAFKLQSILIGHNVLPPGQRQLAG